MHNALNVNFSPQCSDLQYSTLSYLVQPARRTGEQTHSYRISTLTATGAQVAETKTPAGRLIISSGLTSHLTVNLFSMTSERRLHSFGLGVYFDSVSIFAKLLKGLLTFHVWSRQYRQWHPSYFIPHLSNWSLSRNRTNFSWYFSCGIF